MITHSKTSGLTLIELLVALVLASGFGFAIHQLQKTASTQISSAKGGATLDSFQMEALVHLQSPLGLQDLRAWLHHESQAELRRCLQRNGLLCRSMDSVEFEVNTPHLGPFSSRQISRSGGLCQPGESCVAEQRLSFRALCESEQVCSGLEARLLTASTEGGAQHRARDLSLFFPGWQLLANLDIDFSCAESGGVGLGLDPVSRSLLCHTRSPAECENGVPNAIVGMGMLSPEEPCRDLFGFDERPQHGFGAGTGPFHQGYRPIGLNQPAWPESTEGALLQEQCGAIKVRITPWLKIGQRSAGPGACPITSEQMQTMYRPGDNFSNLYGGIKTETSPYDEDEGSRAWGYSSGQHTDVRLQAKHFGHDTVRWHIYESCCQDRTDKWESEFLETQYREIVYIDTARQQTLGRELVAIPSSEPISAEFQLLGLSGEKVMVRRQDAVATGLLSMTLPILSYSDARVVAGSVSAGVKAVTRSGDFIDVSVVENPNYQLSPTVDADGNETWPAGGMHKFRNHARHVLGEIYVPSGSRVEVTYRRNPTIVSR